MTIAAGISRCLFRDLYQDLMLKLNKSFIVWQKYGSGRQVGKSIAVIGVSSRVLRTGRITMVRIA